MGGERDLFTHVTYLFVPYLTSDIMHPKFHV